MQFGYWIFYIYILFNKFKLKRKIRKKNCEKDFYLKKKIKIIKIKRLRAIFYKFFNEFRIFSMMIIENQINEKLNNENLLILKINTENNVKNLDFLGKNLNTT